MEKFTVIFTENLMHAQTVCTRPFHLLLKGPGDKAIIVHAHGCDIKFTFEFWTTNRDVIHMYSLEGNIIGIAGAQSLAESLQHCANLQELE